MPNNNDNKLAELRQDPSPDRLRTAMPGDVTIHTTKNPKGIWETAARKNYEGRTRVWSDQQFSAHTRDEALDDHAMMGNMHTDSELTYASNEIEEIREDHPSHGTIQAMGYQDRIIG